VESSPADRGLGVLVNNRLNMSQQHVLAAKSANRTKHCISSQSEEENILLYSEMVQPRLEYCVHFWAPQFKQDVKVFECFQRRATKMVKGLEEVSCQEQLRILGLSGDKFLLVWRKGS